MTKKGEDAEYKGNDSALKDKTAIIIDQDGDDLLYLTNDIESVWEKGKKKDWKQKQTLLESVEK